MLSLVLALSSGHITPAHHSTSNHIPLQSLLSVSDAPLAVVTQCVLWLVGALAFVNVVVYVVNQIKYFGEKAEQFPELGRTLGTLSGRLSQVFNNENLSSAQQVMGTIPAVSVLMLFVMFRAHHENIFEDDPNYRTFQGGMITLTISLLLLCLDTLTIRIQSDIFGNVSQVIGSLGMFIGYLFLLWGIIGVRSSYHEMSSAAQWMCSLAFLQLGSFVVIRVIKHSQRMTEGYSVPQFEAVSELINQQKLIDLLSATSFSTVLIIALFYLHFNHLGEAPVTKLEQSLIALCTIGVFLQAVAVLLKVSYPDIINRLGTLIRMIAMIPTYLLFVVLMGCLIHDGANSIAAWNLILVLFVLAVLKLLVTSLQEASGSLIEAFDDSNAESTQERVRSFTKLFQDMMVTAAFAELLCVLYGYVHFRGKILLNEEPSKNISEYGYLGACMCIATACMFIQMLAQCVEFFLGANGVITAVVSVAIAGLYVGLIATFVAACT
eukprot:c16609_g1_i1.p1 GENE.c16609_g1_i1~~c16609_g1_i1.p1  ORF type:complete len:493 (-),score=137.36 c16609_g1_i1:356-1834(-)